MQLANKYTVGTTVFWFACSSCTLNLQVLEDDLFLGTTGARTLLNIHTDRAVNIEAFSEYSEEEERLVSEGWGVVGVT